MSVDTEGVSDNSWLMATNGEPYNLRKWAQKRHHKMAVNWQKQAIISPDLAAKN